MPDIKEATIEEIGQAVTELRAEIKSAIPDQEKMAKINAFLDQQEEFNQKRTTEIEEVKKRETEMKERMDELEVALARANGPGDTKNYRESEEFKALHTLVVKGVTEMDREEKALLRTDVDTSGGYLVPSEMDNAILKSITEISNIRSIARVRSIGAKSLEVPTRTAIPTATYEGEAETGGDDTSTYGNETLTTFRQTITIPVTMDMLMDSAFDMETEIVADATEAFAKGEGTNFVLGDGHKKPEGFAANATIQAAARISTTSATIDAEDVILLTGDLKVGYNPVYVMNRRTLAFLRTLKSTTGQFLWQPGMNGPVANTINGFNYILADDMADIASNSYSIAFGDFMRGYTIVDRTGLSIVRDDLTLKKKAIVEFTFNRWNYGQVTLAEAIKLLKTKA